MATYSAGVDVLTTDTAFPADPQVTIPFVPKSILVANESTADAVEVSFDGVNPAGRLTAATATAAIEWAQGVTKVWFRVVGSPGADVPMRVMAEA